MGRLVPVKRHHLLVDALAEVRERFPDLRAVIVGEGYERDRIEARVRELDAEEWCSLPGYLPDDQLVDLYRRAWVVASASAHEGWGMTLTEAAACGTPAVATRIPGHEDAVRDGWSGLLVDDPRGLAPALTAVLGDGGLRARLARNALSRASELTWAATARGTLEVLAAEAIRLRRP
ncbi:MAG: hypothetical protein KatS3mg009_2049 [Acidimicrobiia bacterium]|nr:MAG: hypothetical protein KatS3mg009_2049 [Acidimicrobiia bacterium]